LIQIGRHGDIEDTLLLLAMSRAAGGRKFNKINVARVYFGNWLRDYCTSVPKANSYFLMLTYVSS
jgi:hypothetical protein